MHLSVYVFMYLFLYLCCSMNSCLYVFICVLVTLLSLRYTLIITDIGTLRVIHRTGKKCWKASWEEFAAAADMSVFIVTTFIRDSSHAVISPELHCVSKNRTAAIKMT